MRRAISFGFGMLTTSLVILLAVTLARNLRSGELDTSRYLPLSEVKAGMKGVGKTVFKGTEIEEFQVEVVGIMRNAAPGVDIIFVRSDDPKLKETGFVGGMSGSPVYVEGRLMGAVAYSWAFSKEPYAGVTPVENMLRVAEEEVSPSTGPSASLRAGSGQAPSTGPSASLRAGSGQALRHAQGSGAGSGGRREAIAERLWRALAVPEKGREEVSIPIGANKSYQDFGGFGLSPIPVPMLGRGISREVFRALRDEFEPLGFAPIFVGALTEGASPEETSLRQGYGTQASTLKPGSAVFAKLVEGDAELSTMGTVTEVLGEKIVAFGHSARSGLAFEQPMAAGVVTLVLPSEFMSTKVGQPTETVGTFSLDTSAGMVGTFERKARMVEVEIVIRESAEPIPSEWGSLSETPKYTPSATSQFHFRIVDHPQYTASLVQTVLLNSFLARGLLPLDNSIRTEVEIKFQEGSPLRFRDFFTGSNSVSELTTALGEPVNLLMDNEIATPALDKILIQVDTWGKTRKATIEALQIDKKEVEQGETLRAEVTLAPHLGLRETITFEVPIPADAEPGQRALSVSDYVSSLRLDMAEERYRYEPKTLEQMIEVLGQERSRTAIHVRVSAERFGLSIGAKELPDLPASLLAILSTPPQTEVAPILFPIKLEIPTAYVLEGQQYLYFTVKKRVP